MASFPYIVPGIADGGEAADIDTHERLADDLRRYARDGGPALIELASAPMIVAPRAIPDLSCYRLIGHVAGHPHVGSGPARTSRIYAIDRYRSWARSYSRLWRIDDGGRSQ
ncbi:DUF6634 family protein [Aurantimonas coralicida]|uniref:DUF6634 family protein n=1 Tax=Aurantimonas coralicida TaxID=182270 RepID=UPI001E3429EE|nr:DUF6634 family protein [Aurantimonas coralicida]MCD1645362.1 hypothetical protein [Aurantimonas coralicida]